MNKIAVGGHILRARGALKNIECWQAKTLEQAKQILKFANKRTNQDVIINITKK